MADTMAAAPGSHGQLQGRTGAAMNISVPSRFLPARSTRATKFNKGETRLAWAMVSPWLAGFFIFTAFPMVASLVLSFTEWDILTPPEVRRLGELSPDVLRR